MRLQYLSEHIRKLAKPTFLVYPLVIIVTIPVLLIVNTLWNLRSFNRDVNFIIRHQAVSLANTVRPFIWTDLVEGKNTDEILSNLVKENDELLLSAILVKEGNEFSVFSSSSGSKDLDEVSNAALNNFALSTSQPFAGLTYDPVFGKNVWTVAIPIPMEGYPQSYLFSMKLKTDTVEKILSRTSYDSLFVLIVTIIATLILLANHFIFYKKALRTQQLEELDRLKDEFISMASHELRAPVTALVGYLELLRDKIPQSAVPVIEGDLITLNGLTRDLNNLINDLLEVSRIEQGRLKLSLTNVNVNASIQETVKNLQPLAEQKKLTLIYTLNGSIPNIVSDPDRLRQILTNLISNSIKYSLKGNISVSTLVKDNFVELTVRDTGIGIPAQEISNLFGKFHRVKDPKTQNERGTGLGLWITKQLVESLGGKIYAESIYGTGSSFTFTIPLRKA